MKRKLAGALAALIVLAVPRIAAAADFFLMNLDFDTDKDDPTADMLDPASIVVESNGNRTFLYAIVHEGDEHSDFAMEVDCSASRWRQTHSTHTSSQGEVTEYNAVGDWETLYDGTRGDYLRKTVCDYPNNQPTGDQLYQASDFPTVLQIVSHALTDVKNNPE